MGSVSLEKNYSLDLVTSPTLDLSGTATTPSTVQVFVDGRLVRREAVPPGDSRLEGLPVPAGSGQTRLVVEDAFGRPRDTSAPYSLATSLLAPDLQEYHVSVRATPMT